MYRVVRRFYDLRDKWCYAVGDVFPRKGTKVSDERIAELAGVENRLGVALIEQVKSAKSTKAKRKE